MIAPLDQVRFERRVQLTSSSPKLVALTPRGTHVLERGNPFGGGIGILDQVHNTVHNFSAGCARNSSFRPSAGRY